MAYFMKALTLVAALWSIASFAQQETPATPSPEAPPAATAQPSPGDVAPAVQTPVATPAQAPATGPVSTPTPAPAVPPKAPQEKKGVEKITVTGSYIKRVNVETPAPVQIITREEIERSGQSSVGDLLRDNSSNSFGSRKENSGGNSSGSAHVDLKGLGPARTLVLLDGRRMPTDAVTGAVDLNMIPMAAVERVEILKDGASAIYGSDALAGVVNIITKKEYNGTEISAKAYMPQEKGGGSREYSYVGGVGNSTTNAVGIIHYREKDPMYARDRDYLADRQDITGSPGSYQGGTIVKTEGEPDSFKKSTSWMADPNCPADKQLVRSDGTYCFYNYASDSVRQPGLDQLSLMTKIDHELGHDIKLFTRFGATRKRVRWEWGPPADTAPFLIPSSVADTMGPDGGPMPGVDAGSDLRVRYRLNELGHEQHVIEATSFDLMGGLRGPLAGDWDWEVAASRSRMNNTEIYVSGSALKEKMRELIESGEFNPLAAPGERGSLDAARFQPWEKMVTEVKQADVRATGSLFDLPSGPVSLAVGAETIREEFSDSVDIQTATNQTFANHGTSGAGSRSGTSTYAELGVPLHDTLEMQLAARYSHYSDFGDATTPKAALKWLPFSAMMVRTSYGLGFKAPSLQDLHRNESQQYRSFIDAVACQRDRAAGQVDPATCRAQGISIIESGNEDLEEERSKSFNVGTVVQVLPYLSFSADYWALTLENAIGLDMGAVTEAEARGEDVSKYGIQIKRDEDGNLLDKQVIAPKQNISTQNLAGYDLGIRFDPTTAVGKFTVETTHSVQVKNRYKDFPTAQEQDAIGRFMKPRWRNTTSFGYSRDAYKTTLTGTTIAPQPQGEVGYYGTLDWTASYDTPWRGQFSLGVQNLGNRKPAATRQDLYDLVGRTYMVGYKQAL